MRRVFSLAVLALLLASIPLLAGRSLPMPCPDCGSEYTWHAFKCSACGTEWTGPACMEEDGTPSKQPCPGPEDGTEPCGELAASHYFFCGSCEYEEWYQKTR